MKKILLIISIIASVILADTVLTPGQDAPAPDYSSNFDTVSDENQSIVGNDSLNKNMPPQPVWTEVGVGTSQYTKVVMPDGSIKYKSDANGTLYDSIPTYGQTQTYKDALKSYYNAVDNGNTTQISQTKKVASDLAKENNAQNGFSLNQQEKSNFKNINLPGRGMSIVNNKFLSPYSQEEKDINASKFYNQNFGYSANKNLATNVNMSGASKLKDAYNFMSGFKANIDSRITSSSIKCYISRELIPSFYCSYPDMTNTLYPSIVSGVDQLKVDSDEALKTCGEACRKQNYCINMNVLNSTDQNQTSTMSFYPVYNLASSIYRTDIAQSSMVNTVTLKFRLQPSATFDTNVSSFETFLQTNPVNIRVSMWAEDNTSNVTDALIDKDIIQLKSSVVEKTYTIQYNGKSKLAIKFFQPYSYTAIEKKAEEAKIFANIGGISLTDVNIKYLSADLNFCPFKQFVDNTSQCPNGKIVDTHIGSQVYHICTNTNHKVGPEKILGGFFSKDTCEQSCLESRPCLPTYRQYTDPTETQMFKTKIGCVDEPNNRACTDQKCKDLFIQDYNGTIRPITESVVYNDNKTVLTVENKTLTQTPRPKVNLAAEMAATDSTQDYQNMFRSEMKDTAYKYMVNNNKWNRVSYLIGTPSPTKQAYKKDYINGQTVFSVMLKPNSFDVDSGTNFYLYSVMVFEQQYRAISGMYIVDGMQVDASTHNVFFKDKTYMVKTSIGDWKVFKKQEFEKIKKEFTKYYCTNTPPGYNTPVWYEITEAEYDPNNINCRKEDHVEWPDISATTNYKDRNVFYDSLLNSFVSYDVNSPADYYMQTKFTSNQDYMTNILSDWLEETIEETPGGVFHSQVENQNGLSIAKLYYGDLKYSRGFPSNYVMYHFYSQTPLTYQDLIDKVSNREGEFYALDHPEIYPNVIRHDGDINNDIKPFIFGTPDKTTLSVDMKPSFTEEHQKVFKFLFLYDDNVQSPLANYPAQ